MKNQEDLQALKALRGEQNTKSPVTDSIHNLSLRKPEIPSWLAVLMGTLRSPGYDNPVPYVPPPRNPFAGMRGGQSAEAEAVAKEPEVGLQ